MLLFYIETVYLFDIADKIVTRPLAWPFHNDSVISFLQLTSYLSLSNYRFDLRSEARRNNPGGAIDPRSSIDCPSCLVASAFSYTATTKIRDICILMKFSAFCRATSKFEIQKQKYKIKVTKAAENLVTKSTTEDQRNKPQREKKERKRGRAANNVPLLRP